MTELKARCQTKKDTYTFDYPAAIEAAETQMDVFWPPNEIPVEKDLHCLKTELTPAEYHGVITTLRLFTKSEIVIGSEYWSGRFSRMFPRPDFQRMANCFSFFEINVHAPFYSMIDEVLGLNTDEFYESFTEDPVLNARMEFLDSCVTDKDDLFSIATFSMIEGAVLYSAFAFLKHFQAEGKNKIVNIDAGVSFSVRDENLHSEGGAWAFRTLLSELKDLGYTDEHKLKERIYSAANEIYYHESRIADMVFEKGSISGITKEQLKEFVKSRINLCLNNLGLDGVFEVGDNPIAKWFYKNIGGDSSHDFFVKVGSSYNRAWDESKFKWGN